MIVPRFTQDRCVILTDSGEESLLACAMASEQQQLAATESSVLLPALWESCEEVDLMISEIDQAAVRQAGIYGLSIFPNQSVYPPEDQPALEKSSMGAIQSQMLLQAAHIAIQSGIRRVVWPVRVQRPSNELSKTRSADSSVESQIDEIARTIDRALLVSRLASLDASSTSAIDVVIETPFVDLSNAQMIDLVTDMAVPVQSCWWYHGRTLPAAQERFAFWATKLLLNTSQVEPKLSSRSLI